MKITQGWKKEVEWATLSIHHLYPSSKVPDDINDFLRDIFHYGVRLGRKQCNERTITDAENCLKEIKTLFDILLEVPKEELRQFMAAKETKEAGG